MIEGTEFKCPHCGSNLEGRVKYLLEVRVLEKEEPPKEQPEKQKDGRDERKEGIERLWAAIDMKKLLAVDKGDFWKKWVPDVREWFDDKGWLTEGQLSKLKQAVQLSKGKDNSNDGRRD
ncbi:hypothetical protein ES703_66341 [subsurface metagenome]